MPARFGGPSPIYTYVVKVRWIVGALSVVVCILIATLFFVLAYRPEQEAIAPVFAEVSAPEPRIEVVVSNRSLERGAAISDSVLGRVSLPMGNIPAGAILYRDRQSALGKFTYDAVSDGDFILLSNVRESRPTTAIHIPEGMRLVTIMADPRSGVDGWAVPGTQVDVVWSFVDTDGERKVATIVPLAEIASVDGVRDLPGVDRKEISSVSKITLKVQELDAQRIEFARASGTLSLVLAGSEFRRAGSPDVPTCGMACVLRRSAAEKTVEEPKNVLTVYENGKPVRYGLMNGKWKRIA